MNNARWLVTGASGLLGRSLCALLAQQGARVSGVMHGHPVELPGIQTLTANLLETQAPQSVVDEAQPDVIVHAAGLTNVDACETSEDKANRLHAGVLQDLCQAAPRATIVYVSTDHLWRGDRSMIAEDEPPAPINAYARTKLAGERVATDFADRSLVIRTNFFGPGLPWRQSLSDYVLQRLGSGQPLNGFTDSYFTPIAQDLLSELITRLVADGQTGIWHVAGSERLSKYDFAKRLAQRYGFPSSLVQEGRMVDADLAAPRPPDMSLSTAKAAAWLGRPLPDLNESLETLPATANLKQQMR